MRYFDTDEVTKIVKTVESGKPVEILSVYEQVSTLELQSNRICSTIRSADVPKDMPVLFTNRLVKPRMG